MLRMAHIDPPAAATSSERWLTAAAQMFDQTIHGIPRRTGRRAQRDFAAVRDIPSRPGSLPWKFVGHFVAPFGTASPGVGSHLACPGQVGGLDAEPLQMQGGF